MRTEDIIISSRVRLARNHQKIPFPAKSAYKADNDAITESAKKAAAGCIDSDIYFMGEMSEIKREALVERHFISPALAKNVKNGAVIVEKNEEIAIMIHEEDHIRAQCILDGFDLFRAFGRIWEYSKLLEEEMPVAFDRQLGYLTACPSNVGTGMRASVMLFLPALTESGKINLLFDTLSDNDFTVRGVYGEGSKTMGAMYQISNRKSLGVKEKSILNMVALGAEKICGFELAEREALLEKNGNSLTAAIFKSMDTLLQARQLTSYEFMRLIADVKLGICLQILPFIPFKTLDNLIVAAQPANLCLFAGQELSPYERDIKRADLVRHWLR